MALRLSALILLILLSPGPVAQQADFSTAMGRVKYTSDQIISVLKDDTSGWEARWNRIPVLIYEGFDFRSMSQSVLATRWQRATETERRKFTEFFSRYIEAACRDRLEGRTDQQIIYKNETVRGDRGIVETIIIAGATEIPVNYKLKQNQGSWYIYDVVIEGISLAASYRSTTATIMESEGMQGLVSDVQRRIDKYKQEAPNEAG